MSRCFKNFRFSLEKSNVKGGHVFGYEIFKSIQPLGTPWNTLFFNCRTREAYTNWENMVVPIGMSHYYFFLTYLKKCIIQREKLSAVWCIWMNLFIASLILPCAVASSHAYENSLSLSQSLSHTFFAALRVRLLLSADSAQPLQQRGSSAWAAPGRLFSPGWVSSYAPRRSQPLLSLRER